MMAGERALVSLYGGAKEEGLDILQYNTGSYAKLFRKAQCMWNRVLYHRPLQLKCTVPHYIMCWKEKGADMKQELVLYILDVNCLPVQTDKPAEPTAPYSCTRHHTL